MKKLFLSMAIVVLSFGYEGCGIDKKDALNNLTQSIYVNVNNSFKKQEKLTIGMFESFNKEIENEITQTSTLTLKNLKYSYKNGLVCAEVSKEDVKNSAKEDLKLVKNFKISDLPTNFVEKQKVSKELLNKIKFVKAILKLDSVTIQKLTKLEKNLKDIYQKGEIVFNLNVPNAKIKISGIDKFYTPSESILLNEGEYSYKIIAKNRCPITGEFSIKSHQHKSIYKDLGLYPILKFTSNQKNVKVTLDGKKIKLNSPNTIKKCEGNVVWNMNFEDQVETGVQSLEPNLDKTINQNFTSRLTIKKIKEKVEYYAKSQEVTINYGYAITSDENSEWDSEKRLEVRQFNNYGIYKLGFGILAGTKDKWIAKDMNELEVAISARIQFPEIADTTLHIYRMPLIPYFGIEGGWDFYRFIDKFTNYDTNDITTIFRGTAGITFLLSKQFGFNIEYSHDVMEKKDYIFSAGIVMDF